MAKKWEMPFVKKRPLYWIGEARDLNYYHNAPADPDPGYRCVYPGESEFRAKTEEVCWQQPEPFIATMTLDTLERGRSAKFLTVTDGLGVKYCLFVVDLLAALKAAGCEKGGVIHGYWEFCKRGQNFGIRYVGSEAEFLSTGLKRKNHES